MSDAVIFFAVIVGLVLVLNLLFPNLKGRGG